MGLQAQQLGLIDELGANSEAVQKAASLAHLGPHQVVDVASLVYEGELPVAEEEEPYTHLEAWLAGSDPAWRQELYYLYIEPEMRRP